MDGSTDRVDSPQDVANTTTERKGHLMERMTAPILLALFLAGCCCARGPVPGAGRSPQPPASDAPSYAPPPNTAEPDATTLTQMQNVHFRIDEQLALNIRHLSGEMHPRPSFEVIDFNDPASFYILLSHAEVGMTTENLAYLLNRYVFNYESAPLTIHEITAAGDELRQKGTLHKIVSIPFEMTAEVTVTGEGLIRLHPTSMKICGIPGQGLMNALGIELEDLLDLSGAEGVEADGNDLLMDPQQLLPSPEIRGVLTAVRIEDDQLMQVFGSAEEAPQIPDPSYPAAENFMFYTGGTLHFGKLFMVRSDLQIIDEDASDPLDFFLADYMMQLTAGSSETLPDAGLAAYVPDYNDVMQGEASASVVPAEEVLERP